MELQKLTTILIVDAIEPCLPIWKGLGYEVTVRVPDKGPLNFVILNGKPGELMLQTRGSLAEDLPAVAKLEPALLLYADVKDVTEAAKLRGARVLVEKRTTFYGATETWVVLDGGQILGMAEHG